MSEQDDLERYNEERAAEAAYNEQWEDENRANTIGSILSAWRIGRGETLGVISDRGFHPVRLAYYEGGTVPPIEHMVPLAAAYEPSDPAARSLLLCRLWAAMPSPWLDPAEWPAPPDGNKVLVTHQGRISIADVMYGGKFTWSGVLLALPDGWQPLPGVGK